MAFLPTGFATIFHPHCLKDKIQHGKLGLLPGFPEICPKIAMVF
jgi:hypothetical protein